MSQRMQSREVLANTAVLVNNAQAVKEQLTRLRG